MSVRVLSRETGRYGKTLQPIAAGGTTTPTVPTPRPKLTGGVASEAP